VEATFNECVGLACACAGHHQHIATRGNGLLLRRRQAIVFFRWQIHSMSRGFVRPMMQPLQYFSFNRKS